MKKNLSLICGGLLLFLTLSLFPLPVANAAQKQVITNTTKIQAATPKPIYADKEVSQFYRSWGRTQLRQTSDGADKVALYDYFNTTFSKAATVKASPMKVDGITYYLMFTLNLSSYTITLDHAMEVYGIFRNEHPEYYWLYNGVLFQENKSGLATTFYIVTSSQYDTPQKRAAIDAKISGKVAEYAAAIGGLTTNYEIAKVIHDKMIRDAKYRSDAGSDPKDLYAHNIEGIFTGKGGVCEGYSKAYQYLLNQYNIPNLYVAGLADDGENYIGHAWNLVMSDDDRFYNVDVTWNDLDTASISYEYFFKGSDFFDLDHIPDSPKAKAFEYLYPLPTIATKNYIVNTPVINSISAMKATLSKTSYVYDGAQKKPAASITGLKNNINYKVYYSGNVKAGTAKVTIVGIGNYTGTITKTFKISKANLPKVTSVKLSSTNYTYKGIAFTPTVTVKHGNKTLVKNKDYTIKYTNNIKPGKATITITGKGNYSGTIKKTFTIKKSKSSLKANAVLKRLIRLF